jgi:hypothetical protein
LRDRRASPREIAARIKRVFRKDSLSDSEDRVYTGGSSSSGRVLPSTHPNPDRFKFPGIKAQEKEKC